MLLLIAGLMVFIATHSIRMVAEPTRTALIGRLGIWGYKALVGTGSIIGLLMIIQGYAASRTAPVELWPVWSAGRHLAALASLFAFVLAAAAYIPRNAIRARLRHPLLLGVKLWALGHLLANHTLADLLLFGGLLLWAVLAYRAARRRDLHAAPEGAPAVSRLADAMVIAIGLVAYWGFAFHLHASLIGVRPFG